MKNKKIKENVGLVVGRWIIRFLLCAWTVTIVFPLIWVLYTSFKTNKEFYADVWALPKKLMLENYEFAWNTAQFSKYYLNSFFTVVIALVLTLIITSSTAYVIAKFKYKWVKWLHKFYLISMAIPGVLILVPQYFMLMKQGMTNSLLVLGILCALGSVPVSMLVQLGFAASVDDALLEAADIDGANEFQKFFLIIIPSIKSALFLTTLTTSLGAWNEYIRALIYINDEAKFTVPIGLQQLQNASTYNVQYGGLFAGLVIAMIPIIILYSFFQKPLQEGVSVDGAVKG